MGRSGTAITLFTKFERKKLEQLARKLGAPIEERKVKFGNLVR
jgi:superfamily II DNA/RNA helicase